MYCLKSTRRARFIGQLYYNFCVHYFNFAHNYDDDIDYLCMFKCHYIGHYYLGKEKHQTRVHFGVDVFQFLQYTKIQWSFN